MLHNTRLHTKKKVFRPKTGIPGPFWTKNRQTLKSSTDHTPGALRLASVTSYLILAYKGQVHRTPEFVYFASPSRVLCRVSSQPQGNTRSPIRATRRHHRTTPGSSTRPTTSTCIRVITSYTSRWTKTAIRLPHPASRWGPFYYIFILRGTIVNRTK